MKLTSCQLTSLETQHVVVDSIKFDDTKYFISRDGSGIYVNTTSGGCLAIASENVLDFLKEFTEVWELYKREVVTMDIGSGNGYPMSALSNFAGHSFELDGVKCASMEGWLQSLKFSSLDMQEHVCTLVGSKAKFKGKNKAWWKEQVLWWRGVAVDRHSQAYQDLLDRAYSALYEQSDGFRRALMASGNAVLTHSIGKRDPHHTILTVSEFCGRLMKLRERMWAENNQEVPKKEPPVRHK